MSSALTGAGGLQRFELVGKAQGYTTVTFVYARSWETEEEPVYQLVYDLSVDADLKVTVAATTFTARAATDKCDGAMPSVQLPNEYEGERIQ